MMVCFVWSNSYSVWTGSLVGEGGRTSEETGRGWGKISPSPQSPLALLAAYALPEPVHKLVFMRVHEVLKRTFVDDKD